MLFFNKTEMEMEIKIIRNNNLQIILPKLLCLKQELLQINLNPFLSKKPIHKRIRMLNKIDNQILYFQVNTHNLIQILILPKIMDQIIKDKYLNSLDNNFHNHNSLPYSNNLNTKDNVFIQAKYKIKDNRHLISNIQVK